MPGIVGLITEMPRERAEALVLQMVESIRHAPSYVTGTWTDERLGLYVGWAARAGSFSASMPLLNDRGDITLVFSGEEYPDPETLRCLRKHGHKVEAEGASYLVHLYEEDSGFPAGLNGRFQGILADKRRQTAMLFNDRFGLHRLYYHEAKDAFFFSAEAKAILAVRPELRTLDPRAMGEFVTCGCVLENRSLFPRVDVLPPASAWVFCGRALRRRDSYFQAREWEEQPPLDAESYYRQLREVFSRNLPRYFKGGERIGMSLTGGLDTRMIMAWLKPAPATLPCYTFGSMFRDCRDVTIARRVAQACGQTHEVIQLGQDFLSRFPRYAERSVYLTDGCTDVSHAADLYVNERAARIGSIRMTGNYGGEVLRRVRAFKPVAPASGLFSPDFLTYVDRAGRTYADQVQGHALSFALFRQAPWHHYGLLSLEQTQVSLRSPFLDNDFLRTVYRAPQSACVSSDVSLRLIADGNTALTRIPTDRGLVAARDGLQAFISRGFLDLTIKAEYAYDYGMPQWAAPIDAALQSLHLERLFLGMHKFYHYRVWYRWALSSYVHEILLDSRTLRRPYFLPGAVERIVKDHTDGRRNYTTELHKLLALEIIARAFVDPQ